MALVNRVTDAPVVELMHQALNHGVLHLPDCLDVFLGQLPGAFFEKPD